MKVAYDATQRDYECVLRTGVEGEEDQGIFINEAPHKWNVVYKCTLDSCPLFYTETEGACSCVFERLPTVAATTMANEAVLPLFVSSARSALPISGMGAAQPSIARETANKVGSGLSLSSAVQGAVPRPLANDWANYPAVPLSPPDSPPPFNTTRARRTLREGDVVSVLPTIFDGDEPGSFSIECPERCYGTVVDVKSSGLVSVKWENNDVDEVKLKDLRREKDYVMPCAIY
jgi:hypothetical protein